MWLRELRRVTRDGGLLFLFEHNPVNPLTRHAVNTCPFDINARLIRADKMRRRIEDAGWSDVKTAYRIFFPQQLAALRKFEPHLEWCGLGAQYRVSAVRSS
jgi:hypothetical protein